MRRPSWKKALLVGAGSLVLGGAVLGGVGYALTDVPDPNEAAVQQATIIKYAGGEELARIGAANRIAVDLDQVADAAEHAVLAAEDRGFYEEPGISPRGILRALFANVSSGGVEQGASTITQQYAKNAFLTSERTFSRKVREVFIALKMTQTREKDQILEDYLNTIYFGRGAYGIQAATEAYFGQRAADRLSVAQAAVLASSIRSPAAYDPARHPERAKQRWEYVLDGMVEKGWLTAEERAQQVYPFVKAQGSTPQQDRSGPKGYVIDRVEDELAANGFSEARLARGGLTVQTTLRKAAQDAAVEAVQAELAEPVDQSSIQGALVAVKPGTGEVFAYYGGWGGNGGFDYASHSNPQDPGSTMKPYVLAAALEEGIGLGSRWNGNSPREFEGYPRPVSNFGDDDYGRIDLITATANSVNTVYVALADEVGPDKVRDLAHRAGIGEDVPLAGEDGRPALGIALGIYGVPVIDQANGFATFAARGVASEPFMVKSVVDTSTGESLYVAEVANERAFSEEVSDDAVYAMQQVVERGSARRNGQLEGDRPAAGKTGTTQESNDAWMVGFTPQLSTAVWLGRGNNEPIVGELGSSGGLTGGSAPARIWKAFMDGTHEALGLPEEEFPERSYVGRDRSVDGGGGSGGDGDRGSVGRRQDDDEDEESPVEEEVVDEPAAPTEEAAEPEPTQAPEPPAEPEPTQPPAEQPPPPVEPQPTQPPAEPPPPAATAPAGTAAPA